VAGCCGPASGSVRISTGPLTGLSRDESTCFQADALFPWKTALDNVASGWRCRAGRAPRPRSRAGLADVGGARRLLRAVSALLRRATQRVGLRAVLIPHPKILLREEPFRAPRCPDPGKIMGNLLLQLWTADSHFGAVRQPRPRGRRRSADRVVIMSRGRIRASSATARAAAAAARYLRSSAFGRVPYPAP